MKKYLVNPGEQVNLYSWDPNNTGDFTGGKTGWSSGRVTGK
jgi:hypothetical protein